MHIENINHEEKTKHKLTKSLTPSILQHSKVAEVKRVQKATNRILLEGVDARSQVASTSMHSNSIQ